MWVKYSITCLALGLDPSIFFLFFFLIWNLFVCLLPKIKIPEIFISGGVCTQCFLGEASSQCELIWVCKILWRFPLVEHQHPKWQLCLLKQVNDITLLLRDLIARVVKSCSAFSHAILLCLLMSNLLVCVWRLLAFSFLFPFCCVCFRLCEKTALSHFSWI